MKRIITVQHTQSVHHTNGMVGSWTDWPLTEKGIEQAKRIGERLRREVGAAEFEIFSSDLLRAKQTAEEIGGIFGTEPVYRRELRERNLGKCCGQSVQWLREHIEMQERTVDDRLFSDAESRRDEWNRLRPIFEELMKPEHENVIVVSHGDLLSAFNAMFLGMDVEVMNDCELFGSAGGVSWMLVNDDGKRFMKRMSDMSYVME